ncbi:hypothetical protein GCM10009087_44970 [Sphingomonas oligophenolica]|uniref:UPF0311 protein ABC974_05950 n=1 Tax=Sphingomonas oligophenolica TaxID=301154 RepID=A0ABU9Y023_9SPHN
MWILTIALGAATAGIPAAELKSPGTPDVPRLEFALEELVTLAAPIPAGRTPYGERNIIPITGGTFQGPGITGTILPGGWDWQLRRADGCLDVKADYMLKTDDGVVINVVNRGAICGPKGGEMLPIRTAPVFEAPLGKYEWLAQSAFVGTLEVTTLDGKPAVRIRFYRVG